MLSTTGSLEIVYWIAELRLRDEDEKEALERAREEAGY